MFLASRKLLKPRVTAQLQYDQDIKDSVQTNSTCHPQTHTRLLVWHWKHLRSKWQRHQIKLKHCRCTQSKSHCGLVWFSEQNLVVSFEVCLILRCPMSNIWYIIPKINNMVQIIKWRTVNTVKGRTGLCRLHRCEDKTTCTHRLWKERIQEQISGHNVKPIHSNNWCLL